VKVEVKIDQINVKVELKLINDEANPKKI